MSHTKNNASGSDDASWQPEQAAAAAQAERRSRLFALIRDDARAGVERHEDGTVIIPYVEHPEDKRTHLWYARAFLHGDDADRELGNELIASVEFDHACHFCGAASAVLLVEESERLTDAARRHLEAFVQANLAEWMTLDYRFHGANDNAPAGCVTTLALAGEYFDNPDLVTFARERLGDLDRLLNLRGYISECVSPTYSGITLMYLAELAEYANDEDIRRMALRAEQRVWQELLLHFHPRLKQLVGPFSRAYEDDNANQCTIVMMAIYAALGKVSPFNPEAMLFPPPEGTFAHGPWDYQRRSLAAAVAPVYHPPVDLVAECLNRQFPSAVESSCEFIGMGGAPSGQSSVSLYLDKSYGLGTFGSRLWPGQGTPLQLLYQRRELEPEGGIVDQLAAIRSIYPRLYMSEQFDSMYKRDAATISKEVAHEQGVAFTVQHQGTSLLGYVPVMAPDEVRTIRASLVFPFHHSRPDEVRFGDRSVAGFSAAFPDHDWCFVRDGDVFLAVLPLVAKEEERLLCRTRFSDCGTYGLLSFFNQCGFAPHTYNRDELRSFGNGFVLEVGTLDDYGSFEAFVEAISSAVADDEQYANERRMRYRRGEVELELTYDITQLNLRRAAVNGHLVNPAAPLKAIPAVDTLLA